MAENKSNMDPKIYQQALDSLRDYEKMQKKIKNGWKAIDSIVEMTSSNVLGISASKWHKEIPKSVSEIKSEIEILNQSVKELESYSASLGKQLTVSLSSVADIYKKHMSGVKSVGAVIDESITAKFGDTKSLDDFEKRIEEIYRNYGKISSENQEKILKDYEAQGIKLEDIEKIQKDTEKIKKENSKSLLEEINESETLAGILDEQMKIEVAKAAAEGDVLSIMKKFGHQGEIALRQAGLLNDLSEEELETYKKLVKKIKEEEEALGKSTKLVKSLSAAVGAMGDIWAKKVIDRILEFDQIINDAQRDFGISMDENSGKMTSLVHNTARFGMGIKDTANFMGSLGDSLRTIDFDVLSEATENLAHVQLATGISAENLATMAGEMMRSGKSSKDVEKSIDKANTYSKFFGVNTKKVLEGVSKNIDKMRTMGFVGGEESLARMVAQAERLGQSVDDIFNVAEKARSIEGAMEMAAQLQLAGGSFASINPMDLLAAARKGPEEMQALLNQMGKDIGSFNDKGVFQIDPVDRDRLKIIADATGESMDSITNRIRKQREDMRKTGMIPDSVFDKAVKGIDDVNGEMAKAMISDMIEMKDGKMTIKADSALEKLGIMPEDIANLNAKQIKDLVAMKQKEDERLKDQALENQSLQNAFTALKDTFINLLTILQPAIEVLTSFIQILTSSVGKWVLAVVALTAAIIMLAKSKILGKIGNAVTGLKDGAKELFSKGGFRKTFLNVGGDKGDTKGKNIGGDTIKTKSGKAFKRYMNDISSGFQSMGNKKGVGKGIALSLAAAPAMALLGIASIAALPLALVGLLAEPIKAGMKAIAEGFAAIGQNVELKDIMKATVVMAAIGGSVLLFAYAANIMAEGNWVAALAATIVMGGIAAGLMVLGAMLSGPQAAFLYAAAVTLVAIGATLLLFAVSMKQLGDAFITFTTVDWGKMFTATAAMFAIIPALAAFSLASLMFINPITLLGMISMLGILGMTAAIMIPLSIALEKSSSSLDKMATSVEKLNESLGKLDFEKLKDLKEISQGFSQGSSGNSQLVSALEKFSSAVKSSVGGGASGGNKTIVVQLKMPNGRMIEEQIITDMEKAT